MKKQNLDKSFFKGKDLGIILVTMSYLENHGQQYDISKFNNSKSVFTKNKDYNEIVFKVSGTICRQEIIYDLKYHHEVGMPHSKLSDLEIKSHNHKAPNEKYCSDPAHENIIELDSKGSKIYFHFMPDDSQGGTF